MSNEYPASNYSSGAPTGWTGWIAFAAIMMIVSGGIGIIQGLVGILRDESYFVVSKDALLTFDYTTWGWIHMLLGIVLVAVGIMMMQGRTAGMLIGIFVISLHMFSQLAWLNVVPFWSLIVIGLDIVILYAIIIHGGEVRS